jgi:hypothetical protein
MLLLGHLDGLAASPAEALQRSRPHLQPTYVFIIIAIIIYLSGF